jgi:hypothetical protein
MIQCSSCGKTLDKVPSWLAGTQVVFVCNNCPNRQAKNIAFLSLESEAPKTPKMDDDLEADIPEDEDAED